MRKTAIGVIGLHQSGKSLLINCLLKRLISKVGTGSATTHTIVSYTYSDDEYAEYLDSKGWHMLEIKDVVEYETNDSIYKIIVHLDNPLLKSFTLIDLPGTGYNTKDNATMTKALEELDYAILLATDVKELTSSSSFYTNTLQILQRYSIPYYFVLNCTNITKWSPTNKQNIEVAKSDLDLLQTYEPLSLGEIDEYPLVNLIWYWCSIANDSDELYLKYIESIKEHFDRKGISYNKEGLEKASKFYIIKTIFDKGNSIYLELMRDFKRELKRIKKELCPIGTIQVFAFEEIPQGWLICDGHPYIIDDYPELYKTIGFTFGGKGTKFKVPDLRNQFVRGWDKRKRKLGSKEEDALQEHGHICDYIDKVSEDGEHSHSTYYKGHDISYGTNTFSDDKTSHFMDLMTPSEWVKKCGDNYGWRKKYGHDLWEIGREIGDISGSQGGKHSHQLPDIKVKETLPLKCGIVRTDKETRPQNIALMYCIKAKP